MDSGCGLSRGALEGLKAVKKTVLSDTVEHVTEKHPAYIETMMAAAKAMNTLGVNGDVKRWRDGCDFPTKNKQSQWCGKIQEQQYLKLLREVSEDRRMALRSAGGPNTGEYLKSPKRREYGHDE